jgi:hypothetical protein
MKLRSRLILIALLALPLVSQPAPAQRTYAFGLGGGAAIPVGKLGDTQNAGYNGIVVLAIGVAELPVGVRVDGIFNQFRAATAPVGSPSSSDMRIMGGLFNLIFAFSGTTAKPYLIAGGGLYNVKADVSGAKAMNHFGFNAGLGATFAIGPLATFLESRYHTISRNATKGGVVQFVPITIGLLF